VRAAPAKKYVFIARDRRCARPAIRKDWNPLHEIQRFEPDSPNFESRRRGGYEEPSPFSKKHSARTGRAGDLLGCAQTGTGKTAAFAMPILQRLALRQHLRAGAPIRALILTADPRACAQIDESFAALRPPYAPCTLRYFRRREPESQVARLKKGVDILTARPGRQNDLIDRAIST
jgi:ATP-dependent RNA helicase RhlE